MNYKVDDKIEINGYSFEVNERYLTLKNIPGGSSFGYHEDIYIDEFFKTLGITRETFRKKLKITSSTTKIFPECKNDEINNVIEYLKSLEKPSTITTDYEIY
jgi:hypothetical protein